MVIFDEVLVCRLLDAKPLHGRAFPDFLSIWHLGMLHGGVLESSVSPSSSKWFVAYSIRKHRPLRRWIIVNGTHVMLKNLIFDSLIIKIILKIRLKFSQFQSIDLEIKIMIVYAIFFFLEIFCLHISIYFKQLLSILMPEQNEAHFADNFFKYVLWRV